MILFVSAGVIAGAGLAIVIVFLAEWVRTVGEIHRRDSETIAATLAKIDGLAAREYGLSIENRRLRIRLAELQAKLKRYKLHGNDEESGEP